MRTRALSAIPLLLVLGACGGNGDDNAGSVAPTSTTAAVLSTTTSSSSPTTSTTSTSTTSTTVAALSTASRLRIDGLGPIDVGMTIEQAQAAAGIPLRQGSTPYCRTLMAPTLGDNIFFIATNDGGGKIDVIVVKGGPTATLSGIRVGSARADVLATYGAQVTAVNERRLVYRARDAALRDRALVFVIDNGKVASMYTGNQSHILSDELCA